MTRRLDVVLAFVLGMAAGLLLAWAIAASVVAAPPRPPTDPVSATPPRAIGAVSPPIIPQTTATGTGPAPSAAPATPKPSPAPRPTGRIGSAIAASRGTASWGYGWSGVVTRFPRGTRIRVCGALGCWSGRSVGYGPQASTGRIADLSRAVFARICGDPGIGLCPVLLEVLGS